MAYCWSSRHDCQFSVLLRLAICVGSTMLWKLLLASWNYKTCDEKFSLFCFSNLCCLRIQPQGKSWTFPRLEQRRHWWTLDFMSKPYWDNSHETDVSTSNLNCRTKPKWVSNKEGKARENGVERKWCQSHLQPTVLGKQLVMKFEVYWRLLCFETICENVISYPQKEKVCILLPHSVFPDGWYKQGKHDDWSWSNQDWSKRQKHNWVWQSKETVRACNSDPTKMSLNILPI